MGPDPVGQPDRPPGRVDHHPLPLQLLSLLDRVEQPRRRHRARVRDVQDLPGDEPGEGLTASRGVADELMHEGEEDRLQGEVVPVGVERRGPDQDAPLADAPLDQRGTAAVEARQHSLPVGRDQRAVAEEAGAREVSTARSAEDLEDGVVVVHPPDPSSAPLEPVHRGAHARAEPRVYVATPTPGLAHHDHESTPGLDELAQRGAAGSRGEGHVREHDHLPGREPGGHGRTHRAGGRVEGPLLRDAECAAQKERGFGARARSRDDAHGDRGAGRQHEVTRVVAREPVLRDSDRAARVPGADLHGGEVHRHGALGRERHGLPLHLAPVDVEGDRHLGRCVTAGAHQTSARRDPLESRKAVAAQHDVGDRDVRDRIAGDGQGADVCPRRESGALFAGPTPALEVAHEHQLAHRVLGLLEDRLRELEPGAEAGGAPARLEGVERGAQPARVALRAHHRLRAHVEDDQVAAVQWPEPRDLARDRFLRRLPAVARGHAVRAIEQHHHLARARARDGERVAAAEEGPRERHHEQEDRQRAQREQEPVVEGAAPVLLEGDLLEEHERGELHHLAALLSREVNPDRDRERGEPGQEERDQESDRHGLGSPHAAPRPLWAFWRASR